MFLTVAAAVFVGAVTAPMVTMLVMLAPLLALVGGRGAGGPGSSAVTRAAGLATVGMMMAANVMVVTGVATLYGIPFRHALAVIGLSACGVLLWRRTPAVWSLAFGVGLVGLAGSVVAMGMALPAAPWTAWAQLASRPVLAFPLEADWVTAGRAFPRPTKLTFDETHQVTALSAGVFRVEEGGQRDGIVRDQRLSAGDALGLRAGDRLTIPDGARVRFEAGKRIPGAPRSGVAWAEPPRPPSWHTLVEGLGLAVTVAGGAAAVLGGHAHAASLTAAIAAPLVLIAFALAAASWGVYATWFTPDLGLGSSSLDSLVKAAAQSRAGSEPTYLILMGALGLTLLFMASTAGLANRVGTLSAAWRADGAHPAARFVPDVLWLGMLAVGVILSQCELEAETLLWLGWGLGASAWVAPRLGGKRGATAAGTLAGVVVFVALTVAGLLALPGVAPLGPYPALVAAPAAVAVAAAVGRRPRPSARPLRVRGPASVAGNGRP